jgi:hypothetical protein
VHAIRVVARRDDDNARFIEFSFPNPAGFSSIRLSESCAAAGCDTIRRTPISKNQTGCQTYREETPSQKKAGDAARR